VEWLASMARLGERVGVALKARGKKDADLDLYLAGRLKKMGKGTGYTHRVIKRGQQPGADHLEAIADFLDVSLEWLVRGQGGMDRQAGTTATYDSLTGWSEAAATEETRGRVAAYVIRAAGRSPIFVSPREMSPDFVFRAAMFWLAEAPDTQRRAAMDAEMRRAEAEEDQSHSEKSTRPRLRLVSPPKAEGDGEGEGKT
jgi:hypothetical protein